MVSRSCLGLGGSYFTDREDNTGLGLASGTSFGGDLGGGGGEGEAAGDSAGSMTSRGEDGSRDDEYGVGRTMLERRYQERPVRFDIN